MKRYTLLRAGEGRDAYEALYSEGHLIANSEDGPFTAHGLLEALAFDSIALAYKVGEVTDDYDEGVLAFDGWPETLAEIPDDAMRGEPR